MINSGFRDMDAFPTESETRGVPQAMRREGGGRVWEAVEWPERRRLDIVQHSAASAAEFSVRPFLT